MAASGSARLSARSDRAQETVLHHAGAVSHGDCRDGAVVESRELRAVSISDRRRHRRRIYRDQLHHSGTGARALSWMDRPHHQWQLLDRRGCRRDLIGRKKLFFITLALYLTATAATALSWNLASYALFRFLTGAGIGGEYTAINSTIQELVPARYRGWTDLIINGSFWIGAAVGATSAVVLLGPQLIGPGLAWRRSYFTGPRLSLCSFLV